jgi:hypothetical protein
MKNALLILLLITLSVSCTKEDTDPLPPPNEPAPTDSVSVVDSTLTISFIPRFNGNGFDLGPTYENVLGYPFSTTEMKFYISNLNLHKLDGSTYELSEIELINIGENENVLEYEVPRGLYSGLSYNLGVPAEMNGTQDGNFNPAIYPAGHPLNEQESGMYWQWATGYRFFSFEGKYDTIPNSSAFLPLPYTYHTGIDTLFREVGFFQKTINTDTDDAPELFFFVDIDSIFATHADTVDFAESSAFHGMPNQMELGVKLANNMAKSFVLD